MPNGKRDRDPSLDGSHMTENTSIPLGGVVMIEQVEKQYGVFSHVFSSIGGRVSDFIGCVKIHVCNRLTHGVSTHQILEQYSSELATLLGTKAMPSERSLYRALEKIGKSFPVVMARYQDLITKYNLVDSKELLDFSSTYLEGSKADLGMYGYSSDKRPDKLQIKFGIATGINGIPTALTIQKGNVQDKIHLKQLLKVISNVVEKNSLLIFDAGANTKSNKREIRDIECHYLTLKSKKVGSYIPHIRYFAENWDSRTEFRINERSYTCVKRRYDGEILYIYYCSELEEFQLNAKCQKFEKQKKKGNKILTKRKNQTYPSDKGWVELIPHLQKTLSTIDNVYITGLEGFFILESSIDDDPEKILKLYKDRDKAEKFIRALKEGLELRPVRHWNKYTVIGIFFVCFLANFLMNLTHLMSKAKILKNLKLLKKSLMNLTLTFVYPPNGFRFTILSNVSPQILDIFGDFVRKFEDKSLDLRW